MKIKNKFHSLRLDKSLLLAQGGERSCYIHPLDSSKIIKTLHLEGKHNNQNELEYTYMKYLSQKNVNFNHIPKCYGWVETSEGQGLIFDRVLNFDNTDSKTFRYYVRNHIFDEEVELLMLNELKIYLSNNNILFIDVSLANVFCQEFEKGKFRLVVFDGLGGRRTGMKFNLYMKLVPFAKYKIKKQWKKFLNNYAREKTILG